MMGTNCKIIYGYTDHTNEWIITNVYYRHYDGYPKAIIPLLKKYQADMTLMHHNAKYDGHKFIELDGLYEGVTGVDYIYYIDTSNNSQLKCSIIGLDWDFYKKYNVDNYKVLKEFTI